MTTDIDVRSAELPQWDAADPRHSVQQLVDFAAAQATSAAQWYTDGKRRKKRLSTWCRGLAILFTSFGGITPILASMLYSGQNQQLLQLQFNQYGYLSVGLAGVVLAVDKYYGASSGWMRYITTLMAIEARLESFRLEMLQVDALLAASSADAQVVQDALRKITAFLGEIRDLVRKETDEWIAEFRSSLANLEKRSDDLLTTMRAELKQEINTQNTALTLAAESGRPGAIELTFVGLPAGATYDVEIDGRRVKTGMVGSTCGITDVRPGLREISVHVQVAGGTARTVSRVSKIEPKAIATLSMAI